MIPLSDNIPARTTPYVTIGIIVTCVLLFLAEALMPGAGLAERWAFKPSYLLSRELLTVGPIFAMQSLLVSIFLHGGWLHIISNMLFLWVFGDNVEDRMGHVKYLVFYIACGVVATLAHSASAVFGLVHDPMSLERGVVGASGAIAGILGAYLVLVPGASIKSLVFVIFIITIVQIPAPLFIAFWFILQLFSGLGSLAGAGGGIAYWAHIGGFAMGYVLARRFRFRPPKQPPRPRILEIDVRDL